MSLDKRAAAGQGLLRRVRVLSVVFGAWACCSATAQELMTTSLAEQFGSAPDIRNFHISPSGQRISFLRPHPDGFAVLQTFELTTGTSHMALAGQSDGSDIDWCDWATEERLLCVVFATGGNVDDPVAFTRIFAVDWDGSNQLRLQDHVPLLNLPMMDTVIDWLADEPDHVILSAGQLLKVDITDGTSERRDGARGDDYLGVRSDVSPYTDGAGTFRHRAVMANRLQKAWYARSDADAEWTLIHEGVVADLERRFFPVGYDADRTGLVAIEDRADRDSLIRIDLANNFERSTVFEHPQIEVTVRRYLGKYRRLAAVGYTSNVTRYAIVDQAAQDVHDRIAQQLPNGTISVLDEDWAGRYYLVLAAAPGEAPTLVRYDSETGVLQGLRRPFPKLDGITLAPTTELAIRTSDGAEIAGYLTASADAGSRALPLVVLTRSEPLVRYGVGTERDLWGFDFITQFLAAKGYAVLQANYRGLGGYFVEWDDMGTFRGWHQAVADIASGVEQLIAAGTADESRVCIAGWGSGGYAALMSAVERSELYDCVVSISGVTDPEAYARHFDRFGVEEGVDTFVGTGRAVRSGWAVDNRAEEFEAPVLLIYSHNDIRVPFRQSASTAGALRSQDKDVEVMEYEDAEHGIVPAPYRIDMLARMGDFVDRHIGAE